MDASNHLAFVGADGSLGSALSAVLGARPVRLRCPDLTDLGPLAELASAGVVINAAGPRHHPGLRWGDYLREHVGTATRVARSVRPGGYLVHLSSAAVYGARRVPAGPDTPESPATFPSEPYAWAKLAAEHAARAICRERGVALTVLRPSVVYGPGAGGIVDTLSAIARRGARFVLSPAAHRQHWLHVDLLRAVLEALARRGARDDLPTLVLADPYVPTTHDLNEALRRVAPRALPVPVPVSLADAAVRAWQRRLDLQSPPSLMAFATLALDNEYDCRLVWDRLGVDPVAFGRERFDEYLETAGRA